MLKYFFGYGRLKKCTVEINGLCSVIKILFNVATRVFSIISVACTVFPLDSLP